MSSKFIKLFLGDENMKLVRYECKRCGWEWTPRTEKVKQCPGCRTKLWNKERSNKSGK